MTVLGDDDDTVPTGNARVLVELVDALRAAPRPLAVAQWGAATTPGHRRPINEDVWGHRDGVFVVADGMGGRGGGAVAARVATDGFLALASEGRRDWPGVVTAVNEQVRRAGAERGLARTGTTLLAAAVGGPVVTVVHLGDCRAYRLAAPLGDGARLEVVTQDHDVRSELLAAGLDTREYRERGVALHGLTSFIGLPTDVLRIDVVSVPLRPGDRMLLCTDGVHRQLEIGQLREAMGLASCHGAADRLVAWADERGGRDNATAVVIEVGEPVP